MGAVVMHWPSLFETTGRVVETEWQELFDRFSRQQEFRGDAEHPGWSAAVFDPPQRGLENVRRVTAVVLDYDKGESLDDAERIWGEYYGLIHTTRKHAPESPRFRVVLPLSRDVSAFEYAAIWRRIDARAGGKLDPAPKDPSRFWYTPGVRDGGHFEARRLTGAFMDPDDVLTWPEPAALRVAAPVIPIRQNTTDEQWSREARARAYIAKMPEAIETMGGDAATWAVARKLAADFGLDEQSTFRVLWNDYNPRCRPPWAEKELRHKAKDAATKARISNPVEDRQIVSPARSGASVRREEMPAQDAASEDFDEERAAIADEAPVPVPAVERHGVKTMADLLGSVLKRAESRVVECGVSTGNFELDAIMGGFRRKRITVLGAETSFGKSSFSIMVLDEAIQRKENVLLITAEDSDDTYGQRFMARRARVNAFRIRDNDCRDVDIEKMKFQVSRAEQNPFFLDSIGKPAEHMANAIVDIAKEVDISLVVVDYVQAFSCIKRCQDRRAEVTHIARLFADAIKSANASGLILSQLKRPENTNRPPSMHDLKESGDLENMAEHVLLGQLEVDGEGEGRSETRWLIIGKNKDGPRNIDRVQMSFDPATASFKTQAGETVRRYDTHVSDQYMSDDFEDR
jgi:replicative DNA helicase